VRIAIIAPPFIPVPPKRYGGTELFTANLAIGLKKLGHEVVVYSNGESEIRAEVRWTYPKSHWPINGDFSESLKEAHHTAWAMRDAADSCDLIHINSNHGLSFSEFVTQPLVYTIHHELVPALSEFYSLYPQVHYVAISDFQRRRETMPRMRIIHHGIDLSWYAFRPRKQQYLSFLGRIAPIKGVHTAIAVAKKAGIPLKIAGEVQPMFRDYFDSEVKPHLDGKLIEYVGEADLAAKNELLGNSIAMLFPIQWNEPFGLVMIEAMACGTPVLALPGGSVEEVVRDGISGYVCRSVDDMASRARDIASLIRPQMVRRYTEEHFSMQRMAADYARLYTAIASPAFEIHTPELLEAGGGEHAPA
jgi:glycosyltransferase involved in cell wall biosynthesis